MSNPNENKNGTKEKEASPRDTWLAENFPPTHFMQRPDGTFSVLLTRLQRRPPGMPLVYPSREEAEKAGLVEEWEATPTAEETQVYERAVEGAGDVEGGQGSESGSSHTVGRTPEKSEQTTFAREELSPTHFGESMARAIRNAEGSGTERRFTSNLQMDLAQESGTQVNPAVSRDELAHAWSWNTAAAQVPSMNQNLLHGTAQDNGSSLRGGDAGTTGAELKESEWMDLDDIIRRSR